MSQRNVEMIVGRLLTDEAFRSRFCRNPALALIDLASEGVQLTSVEIEALSRIDTALAMLFAEALDPRIQRADTGGRMM